MFLIKLDLHQIRKNFPAKCHGIINDRASSAPIDLKRLTEADIKKFSAKIPELTQEKLLKILPQWLHDLYDAFEPKLADQLSPHRPEDHKIDLKPGEEPPYFKYRPLSRRELDVARN